MARKRQPEEESPLLPRRAAKCSNFTSTHRPKSGCGPCICVLLAFLLFFLCFPTGALWSWWPCDWWPYPCPRQPNCEQHQLPAPIIPFPSCPDPQYTRTTEYGFNTDQSFELFENILAGNVKSKVHVSRGDCDQKSDILVRVHVNATAAEDVDRIKVLPSIGLSQIIVTSSVNTSSNILEDHYEQPPFQGCGAVSISINFKPKAGTPMLWRYFKIATNKASIELGYEATFETYHAYLSSVSGNIASAQAYNYTTHRYPVLHEVQISTGDKGQILGEWALGSKMDVHAGAGGINMALKPYQWSSGPWTTAGLNVTSTSGDIDIRMPFAPEGRTPSMRMYNTSITTVEGDIKGTLMHGVETNLLAEDGLIDVLLLPYNNYDRHTSAISTRSPRASTNLRVMTPFVPDYISNDSPVLNKTRSTHEAGTEAAGSLWVSYPSDWTGHLEGIVEDGTLALRGSFDDDDESYEPDVKTDAAEVVLERRRGYGGSELKFRVGTGNAIVDMGTV